jgi:hypothetical protein
MFLFALTIFAAAQKLTGGEPKLANVTDMLCFVD